MSRFTALVIPVEGPVYEIEIGDDLDTLETLQGAVGGCIEAIGLPGFISGSERATAYVNEGGKYDLDCTSNRRGPASWCPAPA